MKESPVCTVRPVKKHYHLILAIMTGLLMVLSSKPIQAAVKSLEEFEAELDAYTTVENYQSYITNHLLDGHAVPEIRIPATDFSRVEGMDTTILTDYEGVSGDALLVDEAGLVEYEFEVAESGLYQIYLHYYPVEGNSAAIQRSLFIDGELPFSEFQLLEFPRIWVNKTNQWETDNQGNDIRPSQIEEAEWLTVAVEDSQGYVVEPLSVYLEKGSHSLTMISQREPMLLKDIILKSQETIPSYADYLAQHGQVSSHQNLITIEAETASKKSSQMLYPIQDQSSPAVTPYSAKALLNNTIGGNNWKSVGQWIEWEFAVEEEGYYQLSFHAKQNVMKGSQVSRRIMIDGQVPFEELNDYGFEYNSDWDRYTVADEEGDPYLIYLDAGSHQIRMEVILGGFSTIVGEVEQAIVDLNATYRKVIRITGVSPDEFRDYQIESSIPTLVSELTAVRDRLTVVLEDLQAIAGKGSDKEAVIITMRDQLNDLIKDPERFSKIIGSYKTNVSALGTWIMQVIEQPLQLDTIYFSGSEKALPKLNNSLLDKAVHETKKLYYSFILDYNVIGNVSDSEESITVWIGSGRDQANVLKQLADESFTYETGVNVTIELVDMNTLLQATLAGQGPDVALGVANDLPMNYGLRNAVVDLSEFEDVNDLYPNFYESAWEPYVYEQSVYALPETQTFPVMFYRKDILAELGLDIPQTWDEMKVALSVLSKNQMDLGMLPSEQIYAMLLYQKKGEYYTDNGMRSAIASEEGVEAFREFTQFYSDYTLDRETSVEQRFRTGESPIIIADYTTYNNLMVSAPDIRGLWGFTTVPGTVQEDGSVNKTVTSNGAMTATGGTTTTATVMMSATDDKENAWDFMKWWVSEDTQTSFGKELESLMGAAARYPTANKAAFENLPWPVKDYQALSSQMESLQGIPQVPGGYFTWRNVNNAFYKTVVSKTMAPREALTEYVRYINDEIDYKRNEFNLERAEE